MTPSEKKVGKHLSAYVGRDDEESGAVRCLYFGSAFIEDVHEFLLLLFCYISSLALYSILRTPFTFLGEGDWRALD